MSVAGVIALTQALISGIPKLVKAIREGRNIDEMKVGEFVSKDALAKVKAANAKADDYVNEG